MPTPIYLDHNATTPILPEVAEAMLACLHSSPANPGSQHAPGRAARRTLEGARQRIAELLGANLAGMQADRLIFTSGGTESNNLALRSTLFPTAVDGSRASASATVDPEEPPHLIISSIEHPSIDGTADLLAAEGVAVDRAPVDEQGVVRIEDLEALLRPTTRLVSVMLANNETGVVQPVAEIARRCAARGVPVHTDATQAVGKIEVDFESLGTAVMTFAAHKFHGPVGIGGLLVRGDRPPLGWFGGQAGAERPGAAPVALAVGMRAALEAWAAEAEPRRRRLTDLRDRFEAAVSAGVPDLVVVAAAAERLPHTSNVAAVGLDRQALFMALDRAGVACSTGSACASGSAEPSPPLLAMGLPEAVVRSALRFSLGAFTTAAEIDDAAERFAQISHRLHDHQKDSKRG